MEKGHLTNEEINRVFDNETYHAVRLFQSQNLDRHGQPLTVDGKVGDLTWWSLHHPKQIKQTPSAVDFLQMPAASKGGCKHGRAALVVAILKLKPDAGKIGGNNRGPFAQKYLHGIVPSGILVGVNPFMAWDIEQLILPKTIWLNDFRLRSCGLPRDAGCDNDPTRHLCETSGTCGNSVVVDGKCLLAGTANYALFGKMCRLCHDYVGRSSRFEMQDLTSMNNLLDPTPPLQVASAAYDGTFPTLPSAAENRETCTGRCGISHSGVFRFIWEPYKPKPR